MTGSVLELEMVWRPSSGRLDTINTPVSQRLLPRELHHETGPRSPLLGLPGPLYSPPSPCRFHVLP